MKFHIKNLSEKKSNCVLVSCKSFNLFLEASDFYDVQQIILNGPKNLNDVRNKFQQRIKLYKKAEQDKNNYVIFYKESFAYFYFLFKDLFIQKEFKIVSSLLQMREFVKIYFQLETNFGDKQKFENIIDLEQEKKFVFLTYDQNFLLIKQICNLVLRPSGAFFGSFYVRMTIMKKQILFFGNFSFQTYLLSKELFVENQHKYICCFLKSQNNLVKSQQEQIQEIVEDLEKKVVQQSWIFPYYLNTDIIDIIFLIKHRNRYQKIIVISQNFSDFILRNITLTEYVNEKYSQNVYLKEPQPYFDTLNYTKDRSLLLFKDISQFCNFVSKNYEFIKNNKFIVFENSNLDFYIQKSMKSYTSVECFKNRYQPQFQNNLGQFEQTYSDCKKFGFFNFECVNIVKSIKPHHTLVIKFRLLKIKDIDQDGNYYIKRIESRNDCQTGVNLGKFQESVLMKFKNFNLQDIVSKLEQNNILQIENIGYNHIKFLDEETFESFDIKLDRKQIEIFTNQKSQFEKLIKIIETSINQFKMKYEIQKMIIHSIAILKSNVMQKLPLLNLCETLDMKSLPFIVQSNALSLFFNI